MPYRIVETEYKDGKLGTQRTLPDRYDSRWDANNRIMKYAINTPHATLVQHHAGVSTAFTKEGGYMTGKTDSYKEWARVYERPEPVNNE